MGAEWKPGDVAMVTAYNQSEPWMAGYNGRTWVGLTGVLSVDVPITCRPLAVIDFEDREQVVRLADAMRRVDWAGLDLDIAVAAALREFSTPAKPEVFRHFIIHGTGGLKTAHCGKVWRRNAEANVTIVGDCPECALHVTEGWSA